MRGLSLQETEEALQMTELKPCPLCGCEDIRYKVHQDHLGNWHGSIYCREHYNKTNDDDRCWSMFYARSPNSREEVIEKLIKKWNARPNPWHTGTPTEAGWYLLECNIGNSDETYYVTDYWSNEVGYWTVNGVIRWQEIQGDRRNGRERISC